MPSIFDPSPPDPEPGSDPAVSSDDAIRVGTSERQECLVLLNRSYADGRIDAHELEQRSAQVAVAVTRAELRSATAGLVGQPASSFLDSMRRQEAEHARQKATEAHAASSVSRAADSIAAEVKTGLAQLAAYAAQLGVATIEYEHFHIVSNSRLFGTKTWRSPRGFVLGSTRRRDGNTKGNDRLAKAGRSLDQLWLLTPDGRLWGMREGSVGSMSEGYFESIDDKSISRGLYLPGDWKVLRQRSGGEVTLSRGYDPPETTSLADYLGGLAVRLKSAGYPNLPPGTNARIFK